jgi:hypothetical protein
VITRVWPRLGLPAVLPAQGVCCQRTRNIAAANRGSGERQFKGKTFVTARPAGTVASPSGAGKAVTAFDAFQSFHLLTFCMQFFAAIQQSISLVSALLPRINVAGTLPGGRVLPALSLGAPSRICSCMPGPSMHTAYPSSRRLTRACSIVLRGRCRDQSAGWSGAAWSGAPCPVTTGSAGRGRRPSRPPRSPPRRLMPRGPTPRPPATLF